MSLLLFATVMDPRGTNHSILPDLTLTMVVFLLFLVAILIFLIFFPVFVYFYLEANVLFLTTFYFNSLALNDKFGILHHYKRGTSLLNKFPTLVTQWFIVLLGTVT